MYADCLLFKQQFAERVQTKCDQMDNIEKACKEVEDSEDMRAVVKCILAVSVWSGVNCAIICHCYFNSVIMCLTRTV